MSGAGVEFEHPIFFRQVDENAQYTELAVPAEAKRVAAMLERPSKPSNPRYDNKTFELIPDNVVRVEHGETLSLTPEDLTRLTEAGEDFLDYRADEEEARKKKDAAAGRLIRFKEVHPTFGGVGFQDINNSATVVTNTPRSVSPENVDELERQAGPDFETIGNHQLQMTVEMVGLKDRKGKPITARKLQEMLQAFMTKNTNRKGIFKRLLEVKTWRKLAALIRIGKVSHSLVKVETEYVVKPIPLSAVPRKSARADEAEELTLDSIGLL